MDFDERLLKKRHVMGAVRRYLRDKPPHRPARSAFLIHRGSRLPAKFIIRLAFQEATGHLPKSEQLTGGRASVRVLKQLGFDAVYRKPARKSWNRNEVKNARRRAFRRMLEENLGPFSTEKRLTGIVVPRLAERRSMNPVLKRVLTAVEGCRNRKVSGRDGHALAFDFYSEKHRLAIEYDERQHFTLPRAKSLETYPRKLALGFDRRRWVDLCRRIEAGDNDPVYRDEQRAFYDAIRDVMGPRLGLLPVVRVFEEDVKWEKAHKDEEERLKARQVLDRIGRLTR